MVNTRRVYIYQTSTFYCFKIGNKKLISSRIDFILLCVILTLCRSYHIIRDLTKIYIYYNIFIIHLFSRSCALFYIASIFSRIELYTRYAAAPLVRLGGRCVCGYDPLFVIKFKTSLMIRGPNFHSWSWWIREWIRIVPKALEKANNIIESWRFRKRDLVPRLSTYSRTDLSPLTWLLRWSRCFAALILRRLAFVVLCFLDSALGQAGLWYYGAWCIVHGLRQCSD